MSESREQLGRRNKAAGDNFEAWLEGQHQVAVRLGILACVEKSEPHARVVQRRVVWTSPGVADYFGTLMGDGRSLAAEAKSTSESRLYKNEVKSRQAAHLDAVAEAGGLALLLVEFRTEGVPLRARFAVPWQEVPWETVQSAESVAADQLEVWRIAPETCYLSKFHPGGKPVSVQRGRVYPRE